MTAALRTRLAAWLAAAFAWWLPAFAIAETFTLSNGVTLEGSYSTISSVGSDPLKAVGSTELKQIAIIDNRLTRTFVRGKQITAVGARAAISTEKIPLPQKIASSGNQIVVVGMPRRIDPFDEWGRRIFAMEGARSKNIELVQGITEITPRWTKVEAIEGIRHYIWPMYIATSSIPREQLSKILYHALDAKDPSQRLRIVKLYLQSERFGDARLELEQLLKDFPALEDLQTQVKELRQHEAQRILKEVELRREAGQYRLAVVMLEQFPADGVAGETLLKVRDMLTDVKTQQDQGHKVLKLLDGHVAALKAEATRLELKPIVTEIKNELNINTLDRMASYLRLSDDDKMPAEQKLSLAISGWLLGSDAALDNLGVSASLVKVRDLVRQYMVTTRKPERDQILSLLTSQEGATNPYIAAIIAHMKPPLETAVIPPPGVDVGNPGAVLGLQGDATAKPKPDKPPGPETKDKAATDDGSCAPKDDAELLKGAPQPPAALQNPAEKPAEEARPPVAQPAAGVAQATAVPGLFGLTVPSKLSEEPQFKYWVQTPPEYDPYRRYPCIVTLNGTATTPLQQIDWWAGDYRADAQTRYGQATRHGYIVIAPQWTREHQRQYEFSSREHAAVLLSLRDACKRFSIDTDRVYLTGHSMGGTAAWDIGLSHPDLWAGVIPIVASGGKYIYQYRENGKYLPMYFVAGEKDSATYSCSTDWDHYLTKLGYDTMVVQYIGRGHEPFFDEIQNIFNWMGVHKRDFALKKFEVQSLRPWDNFFWWVETDDPKPISTLLPAEWGDNPIPSKKPQPAETKVSPLAPNGVTVTSGSVGQVTVWLSPELVTFNDTLNVRINGKRQLKIQPKPETLLEDVRTRGDRQHPFWAKAVWPQ